MIRSVRCTLVTIPVLLVVSGFLFVSGSLISQESGSTGQQVLPPCKAVDWSATPEFFNGPGDYYTIAINVRNISHRPCQVDFSPEYPGIYRHHVGAGLPVAAHLVGRFEKFTMDPDQIAHMTYRWKTVPEHPGDNCLTDAELTDSIWLDAPSLMKPVCSDIEVSEYKFGAFPGIEAADDHEQRQPSTRPTIKVEADRAEYYRGERIYLHVPSLSSRRDSAQDSNSCSRLYLLHRSSDGSTSIEDTHGTTLSCQIPLASWRPGYELYPGIQAGWEVLGEQSFEVLEEVDSEAGAPVHFAHSNILRLQILDTMTISRKWGPKLDGYAVDVTLEKQAYQLGEDIPLHIAVKNFDSRLPIHTPDTIFNPCLMYSMEVIDSSGKKVSDAERSWRGHEHVCSWNGPGSEIIIPQGKLIPVETTLEAEGWLPNRIGDYEVRVKWCPRKCAMGEASFHILSNNSVPLKTSSQNGSISN